ncbi:LamG domain-containing protein [Streptacidiphilus sp. PAMC 29251]
MRAMPHASALRAVLAAALALVLTPLLSVPVPSAAAAAQARTAQARTANVRAAPARKQTLVFDDEFGSQRWGRRGAVWSDRTTAYPDGFSDLAGAKLDQVQPAAMKTSGGLLHVTATARTALGPWRTGLLTTEPWNQGAAGGNGFELRTGDYAVVRMKLPGRLDGGGHGAWPGVWTWRDGSEVDIMEWHSETPDIIEFANHARSVGTHAFPHSPLVGFGRWITVAVRFGATDVSWYLGNDTHPLKLLYHDRSGVGAGWHAYLIANLSVSDQPGRVPVGTHPITMAIDKIQVYR